MKLSTAIRIGSMTTRHITKQLRDGGNGRCAIGAALDAINALEKVAQMNCVLRCYKEFPILKLWELIAFEFDGFHEWFVWNLNDTAPLTREEIADCVERFENYIENGNKHPHETAVKSNKELVTI